VQVSPKTKIIFRYVISGFRALLGYYSLCEVPKSAVLNIQVVYVHKRLTINNI